MTAYEGVLSCYLSAMEAFNSSFAEIDNMDLELLLDLIRVSNKNWENRQRGKKSADVYINEIL